MMKTYKIPLLAFLASAALCSAGDMTVRMNALRASNEYSFVPTDVSFRFGWLASSVEDANNTATHMLISGLYPVGDSASTVYSSYEAIDISDGEVMDVGIVYLTLPEGSEPPPGSVASPIVGVVQRTGPWSSYASTAPSTTVGESAGASTYNGETGEISLMLVRDATTFTGTAAYTVVDQDTIDLAAFSVTDSSVTYNFAPTTLVRDGGRFYGTVMSTDNGVGYDSMIFVMEMVEIDDVDGDQIPDIVDAVIDGEVPVLSFWQETYNFTPGGNDWFQNVFGAFWTVEGSNWVYSLNFSALDGGAGGWCWIATASGNDDAFWFYNAGFAEWIYFSAGGDGLKKIWSTPDGLQNGFFYLNGTGWVYYLEEKKDGFHWGYVTVDGGNSYITTRQNAIP